MRGKSWGYEIRYPKGKDKQYKVNGVWTSRSYIPERRAYDQQRGNSLEGFMWLAKSHMAERNKNWLKRGRNSLGENEFLEKKTINKLMSHYNEQVERYGDVCPITLIKFTTIRTHRRQGERAISGEKKYIFSNISIDRIFDHINYTKQNTLFTSSGWNLAKGIITLDQFKYLFKDEVIKRYKKILMERFPDQAYKCV